MGILNDLRDFMKYRRSDAQYLQFNAGYDYPHVLDLAVEEVYAQQPNLQAVVTFLADNMAELPAKVYERAGETDRRRVRDSAAAKLVARPNATQTWYELMDASYSDFLLYGRCMWLTVPDGTLPSGWSVMNVPPVWIQQYKGASAFAPTSVVVRTADPTVGIEVPSDYFVLFHNYNPSAPYNHQSPVNALRQTLGEQVESERFRRQMWRRGGRFNAYITRPKDVQPWSSESAERFKTDLRTSWVGDGGMAGGIPVLEDGMEIKAIQFNSREAQWAEAKKFSREDVAAVYHVNPSLIWHTDSQTYASAKDNARALYTETLAPRLTMFEQRINAFLLPRIGEPEGNYLEFDMQGKLRGSFEEQTQVMQSAVGGPWMTPNEARARVNLPAIEGGDELVVPLNVLQGAQAVAELDGSSEPAEEPAKPQKAAAAPETKSQGARIKSAPSDEDAQTASDVFAAFLKRQQRSVTAKIGAGADEWWDSERWDAELASDLMDAVRPMGDRKGRETCEAIGTEYQAELTAGWLMACSEARAKAFNKRTRRLVSEQVDADEGTVSDAFAKAAEQSGKAGASIACAVAAFAVNEAVNRSANRLAGRRIEKTWVTTSANPRGSHAAMNGETVAFDKPFSNGAMYPGDLVLDADESCGCMCQVEISIE